MRHLALTLAIAATAAVGGCSLLDFPARLECGQLEREVCLPAIARALAFVPSDRPRVMAAAAGPACPPGARGCGHANLGDGSPALNVVIEYADGSADTFTLAGGPVYLHPGRVVGHVGALLGLAPHDRIGPVVAVWPPP